MGISLAGMHLGTCVLLLYVVFCKGYLPHVTLFNHSTLFLCQDAACAMEVSHKAVANSHYIVAWQTSDFAQDPYIAVYYTRIYQLLEDLPCYHLIFDGAGTAHGNHFLQHSLNYLPSSTIFVSIQDAGAMFDVCYLAYARTVLQQYPPPVLIHLNHEYPWKRPMIVGTHSNDSSCTVADLPDVYNQYGAVFRNYFHASLVPPSHYMTLGSVVIDILENVKVFHIRICSLLYESLGASWCT